MDKSVNRTWEKDHVRVSIVVSSRTAKPFFDSRRCGCGVLTELLPAYHAAINPRVILSQLAGAGAHQR